MLKKIISIIQIPIKIMLVCVMAYGIYTYFNQVFINEDIDYGASFHSLPNDTMDVIVLGSSHAQYSFVPNFFYEDTGFSSYVMGSPCQPLEVSYEMLKEALKTQSPQLVILEVYTAMPLRRVCEADVCYVAGQYLMTGDEKYNTINYLDEEKAKTYYNDFLNLHNNWKDATTLSDWKINPKLRKTYDNIDTAFGYIYQKPAKSPYGNHWKAEVFAETIDVELDELDLESLNNIYNLCHENDIELLLYKTPIDGMDVENQSYLHKVWEWANAKDVAYLDFFELQDDLNYLLWLHSDSYHSYVNGAGLITATISDFVKDNYDIKHTHNEMLDTMYEIGALYYDIEYLRYEYNINNMFRRMKNDHATIMFKFNSTDKKPRQSLIEKINELGFVGFDGVNDYYGLVINGELVASDNYEIEVEQNGKIIRINQEKIKVDNMTVNDNGNLSLVFSDADVLNYAVKNIEY